MRFFLLAGGVALSVAAPAAPAQASYSRSPVIRSVGVAVWLRPPVITSYYNHVGGSRFGHKVG